MSQQSWEETLFFTFDSKAKKRVVLSQIMSTIFFNSKIFFSNGTKVSVNNITHDNFFAI